MDKENAPFDELMDSSLKAVDFSGISAHFLTGHMGEEYDPVTPIIFILMASNFDSNL